MQYPLKLSAKAHSFNILCTMDGLNCPTKRHYWSISNWAAHYWRVAGMQYHGIPRKADLQMTLNDLQNHFQLSWVYHCILVKNKHEWLLNDSFIFFFLFNRTFSQEAPLLAVPAPSPLLAPQPTIQFRQAQSVRQVRTRTRRILVFNFIQYLPYV